MKVLFVHNIRMYKDTNGDFYTHSSYNQEVWRRYLGLTQKLSVITRKTSSVHDINFAERTLERFDIHKINNIEVEDHYKSVFSFINPFIRKKNKDIIKKAVLSHDYIIARIPSHAGEEAIKYASKYKKPYLIEVVACPWDGLVNHSLKGKLLAPMAFIKMKRNVKNSKYAIYVTNSFLQKRYPTRGKQVNCSNVALKEHDKSILENRLKKISEMTNDHKIIIGTTAAVNVKYKGQQYVIQALAKLKSQGITNFEYQLVGGGNINYLLNIAKKYDVEDQVKFLGSKTSSKVFEWLETIDIYAQPSRQEGLPRALIEAMSKGVPALGARTAGIPELLDKKYIFSNKKNNIEEIVGILTNFNSDSLKEQAIRNYMESEKYKKNIIEKRRNVFLQNFIHSEYTQ